MSDLSGYSALAASNERQSLLVAAVLAQQASACVADHNGRLVKTMGDAALMEFTDAREALAAVEALHQGCANAFDTLKVPALPVHSAMHIGEVTEAPDGDIFGHTVNVAARLQGEAASGEIVMSEAMKNRLALDETRLRRWAAER
jgi:class 3 adenylate cyclase